MLLFDKEIEAEEFGRKSMKRGFEHKVVEYNNDNYDKVLVQMRKKKV